ncbi:MAG: Lrp/AsnC ligand binding domain-containing protein [Candidatus Methanoperedens sp.]|nr:Lrp/AsnC ligand binding domain-containing protein [Candidatus Methanoperedens sp.]
MVSAYVLTETVPGKNVKNVRGDILKIKGVKSADYVTGPYDVVVRIEAKNMADITEIVAVKIQSVKRI